MITSHDDLARRLREAYAAGTVPPLRDGLRPTDAAGAYAVQEINTSFWQAQRRRVVGRKAGLAAKAVQAQPGADLPDLDTTADQVAATVTSVHAAIGIVDSRIADWKITSANTVADNGSSAFFVRAGKGLPLAGLDLVGAAMEITVNAAVASTGVGAAAPGNPLEAVASLARTFGARGAALKAGDILLAGAPGPMVALSRGDVVCAKVSGIGECSFIYGAI